MMISRPDWLNATADQRDTWRAKLAEFSNVPLARTESFYLNGNGEVIGINVWSESRKRLGDPATQLIGRTE